MRILHLVSYSLYSGPVPPTLGLALAQRAAGDVVYLAVDCRRGNFDGYEEAALPQLQAHALAPPLSLVLSHRAAPWEHVRDHYRLAALCRRQAIDVLHCHMTHDHLLAALVPLQQTTLVRTLHAPRALRPRLGQGSLWRRTAGLIVRSAADHRQLQAAAHPPPPVAIVPAGIAPPAQTHAAAVAAGEALRRRLGVPVGATLVGQAALLAGRGQAQLLQAVADLRRDDVHVALAGLGEAQTSLRRLTARLGLTARVHFLGYVPQPQLHDFYAALDLAFVGRLGNDAGGRAALEAMVTAVPLLAYGGAPAVAELGAGGRATLFEPLSAAALQPVLAALLADWPAARGRALQAQAHVLQHRTFAAEAAATRRFYQLLRPQQAVPQPRPWLARLAAWAGPRRLEPLARGGDQTHASAAAACLDPGLSFTLAK